MRRHRVAVIEDHRLQRTFTIELLRSQSDLDVVFAGESLPEFLQWLSTSSPSRRPHLVLLDLMVERGHDADPIDVRRLIAAGYRVLVFSAMASSPQVRQMLEAGIDGIIGKRESEADLLTAVRQVLSGLEYMSTELASVIAHDPHRPKLSIQEERVLILFSSGIPLAEVASSIGVKKDTAKKYLQRVRAKYTDVGRPVRTKLDMNRAAIADGFIRPDATPQQSSVEHSPPLPPQRG